MRFISAIQQWWIQTYKRVSLLPFIFILIAIEVYFFINGRAHFPDWDSSYGSLIQVYLIMTIVFLLWAGRKTKQQLAMPLKTAAFAFVSFFIGTYIILTLLSAVGVLSSSGTLDGNLFWQTVFLQVCVVATAEELMFRGVMLELTGVIISSIAFAAWHMYAYQIFWYNLTFENMNYGAIIFAFLMGVILALIARKKGLGLPATIGVHASYNLFVVGAFATLAVT